MILKSLNVAFNKCINLSFVHPCVVLKCYYKEFFEFVCTCGSAGIGIQMTEPLYVAPSLADLPRDVAFPQNLPSIACVHVLDPQPGDSILDMCAAPGHFSAAPATTTVCLCYIMLSLFNVADCIYFCAR